MKYYYFVTYVSQSTNGGIRWGNYEYVTQKPITTYADISKIEDKITKKGNCYKVAVMNYILLREEHDGSKVEWI